MLVLHAFISALNHHIDQIHSLSGDLSGLHRPSADKNRGDIEAHGGHEHSGGDFVAVAYADHSVGTVGVDHIFDRIGYHVA